MSSEIWNLGSHGSAERPASLCLFARLPAETWRQLIGLLSNADVAACSCSTSHEDTKRLLMGYMRRRCCISTFKRLLVLYGAITGTLEPKWDTDFWNESELRKDFWRLAMELIFLYDRELLQEGRRCERVIHQDYIHSCGILFACKPCSIERWKLQDRFRRFYGAPNHLLQPWFVNSLGLVVVGAGNCSPMPSGQQLSLIHI